MVIRFPAQVRHKLTLYFTHRYFDAALASFPCIFLRVIVGKSAPLKNKPTGLPTLKQQSNHDMFTVTDTCNNAFDDV